MGSSPLRSLKQPFLLRAVSFLLLGLFAANFLCAQPAKRDTSPSNKRPATWAVKIDSAGLNNLHLVSTNFYRGAQPSKEGMLALQKMGIKTVVNLRGFHSDQKFVGKLELNKERFHFNTWHAEDEDVVGFLKIVTDTNRMPVFVHCLHGADRTGLMCAMYRITVCNWTRDEAIREMTEGGYGFHPEWQNLIHYLRTVDVDKIRRRAGIQPVSESRK